MEFGNIPSRQKKVKRFGRNLNVKALYFDEEGLLAGDNKRLFRLSSDIEDFSPVSLNGSLKTYAITAILKKDNYYLLGTANDGVIKASLDFKKITYLNLPPLAKQKFPIKDILPLDNGQFCIATDGIGLIFIDGQGNFVKSLSHDVNNINSISSNGVYDVMIDKENILWVATYGGGINTRNLSANYFQNITHQINDKNSIVHSFTRSILEDKEGNIWFGTREGISIWNKKTNQWKNLPSLNKNNQTPSIIMNLKESGDFIWAATYGDGVFKINKKDFTAVQYHKTAPFDKRINVSRVYALATDAAGNCWLGGIEDKVQVITPNKGILSYPIAQARTIINSKNGGVIIGGRNGVQTILNEQVIDYEELKTGQNGLTYTNINCLHEDNSGNLTIGTNGNGLLFYNPNTQQVNALNISDGLPSDIVQGLIYDNEQTLWISTTKGLAAISFGKDTLVSIFNKADGLVSTEFNYSSFAKFSNGQLAFGGIDGVTLFMPAAIATQEYVPTVIFEDFEVLKTEDGKANSPLPSNINLAKNIKLAHYENAFRIKYAGILHSTPSKVRYSWTMEGMSDKWSDAAAENQINLNNLSSGNYVFKVKAANRDGVWSDTRQLNIEIQSPWWATTTAYIIYALLAIGLLIGAFYLVTALLKKQNADEQIAFFNNITHELKTPLTILLSTLEGASKTTDGDVQSNKKIKTTVKRLNTLFEQLLNFNKVTSNRFEKREIAKIPIKDHVQQIANSFKPLLEERNIAISLNNNLDQAVFYYDKEVLNKILFNLISNAVKYSKDDGAITIHLDNDKKNNLRVAVEDNGIGIPKDQQKFILKRYLSR